VPGKHHAAERPAPWGSGLVIVDKPGGMTSHDVVARIRRLARTRRVGHAGTLDPMATGVLVIGIEKATRLLGHLMLTEKTYQATIRLGQSTTTDDAEGEPTGGSPATGIAEGALKEEIAKLTGDILQVPSSVSAIKVNGQRAYKLTRAGEAPELAARPVTIHEFAVTAIREQGDFLDVDATIRCSSGTYIRALARDLGAALGTGGHLTALRRTAVGPYTLAQAHALNDLEDQGQDQGHSSERLGPAPDAHPEPHASPKPSPAAPPHPGPPPALPAPPAPPAPLVPEVSPPAGSAATAAPLTPPAAFPVVTPPAAFPVVTPPAAFPVVTPLAVAAAAAFARVDLTFDEARRLAQGARLPVPPAPQSPLAPRSPEGTTAPDNSAAPLAAFDPDGTLIALVTVEDGRLRSLAVFVDAAGQRQKIADH